MSEPDDIEGLTPSRLAAVLAVAETASFSVAARRVGTSQSNVSRAVAAVEGALGTSVFDRSTRSVRLTDAGRDFVERAALVNAELHAAVRAARPPRRPAPRLTIACLTSVSELHLATAVAALGRPRFRCIEGLQTAVEEAVLSGRATAGIGDLAHVADELAVRPLWRERFRVAVPRGHRLARRGAATFDDLDGDALVGFSRDAELRATLDRELASARRLRTPDFVVDRYRTALSMVAEGFGVMVVPAVVAGGLPAGVGLIDLDHPGLQRTMGVLCRPDSGDTPRVDRIGEQLAESVAGVRGVEVLV